MKSPFLFFLGGAGAVAGGLAGVLIAGTSSMPGSAAHLGVDGGVLQVTSLEAPAFQHEPDECSGMRFSGVVHLGNGKDVWNAAEHGSGPFLVFAGHGMDVVTGSDGADCLVGGAGKDTLDGGPGDDVVIGGAGGGGQPENTGDKDELGGGPGADTCVGEPDEDTFGQSCEAGAPVRASGARGQQDGQQVPQQRSVETKQPAPAPTSRTTESSQSSESAGQPTSRTESGSSPTSNAASSTTSETPKAEDEEPAGPTSTSEPSTTK